METRYNQDINPTPATMALYKTLAPVFNDNPLRARFNELEKDANRYKARYWRLTRLALVFISFSVFYAIISTVLGDGVPQLQPWVGLAGGVGAIGIVIEMYIIGTRLKEKWLLSRFGAERLRSYIAQTYAYGASTASADDFKSQLQQFYHRCEVEIDEEINKREAAFRRFKIHKALDLPDAIDSPNPAIFDDCRKAYERLRVEFQKDFIDGEVEGLNVSARAQNSWSDVTFYLGAILSVAGMLIRFFELGDYAPTVSKMLVLFGTGLFFASALSGILGLGGGTRASYGRYTAYQSHIAALPAFSQVKPQDFVQLVREMEMEALRELDAFCLQFDSVSLRI